MLHRTFLLVRRRGLLVVHMLKAFMLVIMRVGLGLIFLLSGASKFVWPEFWAGYIAPLATTILPINILVLIYIGGAFELIFALTLLLRWHVTLFANLAALWLIGIVINVLLAGMYDIALRDVGLVILALAVANLDEQF